MLLSVTVPPQVLIMSGKIRQYDFVILLHLKAHLFDLLTQQTPPKGHDPLERPPKMLQTLPGAQIPDSLVGDVQLPKDRRGFA